MKYAPSYHSELKQGNVYTMSDYIAPEWQLSLKENKLCSFADIWQLDIGWFEEPNKRRGGWSGVSKTVIKKVNDEQDAIFIKRQQNHIYKTWQSPINGFPTFQREYDNIILFHKKNIPTLDLIYFAKRKIDHEKRAILITKALTEFQSLQDLSEIWHKQGWPSLNVKNNVLKKIAQVVRQMHDAGFRHGCLYPKHIFINICDPDNIDVRIIDLEKTRRSLFKSNRITRDLAALRRHTHNWSTKDQVRFLKYYTDEKKLTKKSIRLAELIEWRNARKSQ